jgi:hypothetical protein
MRKQKAMTMHREETDTVSSTCVQLQSNMGAVHIDITEELHCLFSPTVSQQIDSPRKIGTALLQPFQTGIKPIILINPQKKKSFPATLKAMDDTCLSADTDISTVLCQPGEKLLVVFPVSRQQHYVLQTVIDAVYPKRQSNVLCLDRRYAPAPTLRWQHCVGFCAIVEEHGETTRADGESVRATTQARKILIAVAQRRQRPGAGSTLEVLTTRTCHVQFPDLSAILHPLQWAVVGAAATRMYMPERATRDLDIVVLAANAAEVRQRLITAGFQYTGELTICGSSWRTPHGWVIDVLEGAESWYAQAIAEAQQNRDAQGLPVLPFPYLVFMKFQAGHVQDLADVTRMLGQADDARLTAVRQLFAFLLPEDVADLESLIALGQLEMHPPPRHEEGKSR